MSNIRGPSNFGSTTTLQNRNAVNEKINRKPIKLDDEMPFDFTNEDQFNSSSNNNQNSSLSNNASTVNLRHRPPPAQTPPQQHHSNPIANKRMPKKIDLSKQTKQKPDDVASIRIRDPVTSKVRTIYLKDSQIEELSKRHLEDKNKVEKAFGANPTHAKPPSPAYSQNYNQFQTSTFANSKMTTPPPPNMYNDIPSTPSSTKSYKKPSVVQHHHQPSYDNTDKPSSTHDTISHNPLSYDSDPSHDHQDDVEKLIERHQAEKLRVNEFEASPYVPQEVEEELSNNYDSKSLEVQSQAPADIDSETGQAN